MGKAETIRTGKLGKKDLRLVHMNGTFFGLVDGERCAKGDQPMMFGEICMIKQEQRTPDI
ncbi:hypothetical protein [Iodidimonas nitroreducens]|nr:hypothetical protein [Iodidimonas nitroreducens]